MFNIVCKMSLLHFGRRCTITTSRTTNYYKNFAIPVFIRGISTTTTTTKNEHSFTVSYLISSCGFSLKSALLASKHVYFDTPEKPDSVIAFFKSHGFSEKQILRVIKGHPQVLRASPEKTLLPKLEFFYSKGFSSSDLAKISSAEPHILHRSLENYIIPNFNHLNDLLKSNETTIAVFKCKPSILRLDVETNLARNISVLRDIGVPDQNIHLFLKIWHRPNESSFHILKTTVNEIKEMGINPLKSKFIIAVVAKLYGERQWESRVNIYRRWGWSEEEFLAAFRKNPLIMTASKDKIMRVMDFLVNKMDIESSAISKYPYLIGLSMEKRFIPRAAVFKFLLSKGLINRKNTNLMRMFKFPEETFLQKFVNSYDVAPELLKLYQEKLGLLTMTKTSVSRERIV